MDNILKYFNGEKWQCSIGIVISLLSVSISIYLFSKHKPIFNGMAYTIIPLSLLLLMICVGVVWRTPKDIQRVQSFYTSDFSKIKKEELPRMQKVMKSFAIIKKVELAFIAIGILLLLFFRNNQLVLGIAIGLMVMGILLYLFDHLAEARGMWYVDWLIKI